MEEKVIDLLKKHEKYREESINLIPSENKLSRVASKALSNDLASRYGTEWYGGGEYSIEIYEKAIKLAKKLFKTRYAFITISGNICDLAAIFSFSSPHDEIAVIPKENGGYPLGYEKFDRRIYKIPMKEYEINVEKLERKKFPLILLASSLILFPLPVKEISQFYEGTIVYDSSHVLGLIAGGEFQQPLKEGAHVIIGSTHKTFPGPQGGVVLTNNGNLYEKLKEYLLFDFDTGIGLIDNMHMNSIASLSIVFEEMIENGRIYARQIIKNARSLAFHLDENGLPVKYKEREYTQSHQILLDLNEKERYKLFKILGKNRIFIDKIGRIGVAEVTHIGMKEGEMEKIAEMIIDAYNGKDVKENAMKLAREFYEKF